MTELRPTLFASIYRQMSQQQFNFCVRREIAELEPTLFASSFAVNINTAGIFSTHVLLKKSREMRKLRRTLFASSYRQLSHSSSLFFVQQDERLGSSNLHTISE